ncbi:hypothetical protein LOZ57_002323 [Ophidiomyces ophidiicola]|uniref:uncharacterized protein n=1 Tax=Ophidiomyces ophidiicola TaxID=1387563 RepID=UPI0020C1D907|nr:uncharacterized protein LOZ57_002323 [Ophidiomyces ophidiicola]KAI1949845.1 hypothetical protein LOZ57_002323 [Ophidiomyces ophidiicola]
MAHSIDVSDIEISVQYDMFVELSVNMLWQQLNQTTWASDWSGTFVLLVKKNYKDLLTVAVSVAVIIVRSVMISMNSLFVEDDSVKDAQLSSELKMKSVSGTKSS